MFKHILIPIAPGHGADYAEASAAARKLLTSDGKISALSVVEEIPAYIGVHMPEGINEQNLNDVLSDLKQSLDDDVTAHTVEGHSAQTILTWAKKNDVDCIIVSSHRPGFSDYFIGSTAARVVRHAQCAVVVLR